MDASTIARWRMHNLLLWHSDRRTPGEVIDTLAASQGQDFLPGLWSIAQRTSPLTTYDEATTAFDRGDLVRTHVLRPTWHLTAPADLRWLLTATAPRVHKLNAYYYRQLGVDEDAANKVRAVLERILPGRALTREEIGAELGASGNRLAYLMMWAELEQWVCSGPRAGNQPTYSLVAERAPVDERDRDAALHELALRYFSTRSPATVKDLAGWASLTVTEANAARATLEGFDELDVDGRTYVVRGEPPVAPDSPVVDLVQAYDECIMSYSESKDVLAVERQWDGGTRPPAYMHAILLDGQVVGHWRYDRDTKGRPERVETFTYRPMTGDERQALEGAVERFGAFAGRKVELA